LLMARKRMCFCRQNSWRTKGLCFFLAIIAFAKHHLWCKPEHLSQTFLSPFFRRVLHFIVHVWLSLLESLDLSSLADDFTYFFTKEKGWDQLSKNNSPVTWLSEWEVSYWIVPSNQKSMTRRI
jgi:hypothetical protein